MKTTIINISWEEIPFDKDFSSIKEKINDDDFGLYQIYGYHPAYGKDSLLYIGKAQLQHFGKRLNERNEFIESYAHPTSIRLGKIVRHDQSLEKLEWDIKEWGKMIDNAERMLLKAHMPPLNKQEVSGLFSSEFLKEGDFIVLNWGDFGQLLPEISTFRMSYKYWDYNTPLTEKEYNEACK